MKGKKKFIEKNSMLVREFDRYILEYPDFAEKIPDNALVVMQIEGDDEFNDWARKTAKVVSDKVSPIIHVIITELKPVRSCIEKLKLESIA